MCEDPILNPGYIYKPYVHGKRSLRINFEICGLGKTRKLIEKYAPESLSIEEISTPIDGFDILHPKFFEGLTELYLSGKNTIGLSSIPNWVTQIPLQTLFVCGHPISEIPDDLNVLIDSLDYLNLSGNYFEEIPPQVWDLNKLTSLSMENNMIESVYLPKNHAISNLMTINLSRNPDLRTIHPRLFDIPSLIGIDLSWTGIHEIPLDKIRNNPSIRKVIVANTPFIKNMVAYKSRLPKKIVQTESFL